MRLFADNGKLASMIYLTYRRLTWNHLILSNTPISTSTLKIQVYVIDI